MESHSLCLCGEKRCCSFYLWNEHFLKPKWGKTGSLILGVTERVNFVSTLFFFLMSVFLFFQLSFCIKVCTSVCILVQTEPDSFRNLIQCSFIILFIIHSFSQSNHTLGYCRSYLNSCFHPNRMFFSCFQLKPTHLIQFVKCKPISVVVKAGMLV